MTQGFWHDIGCFGLTEPDAGSDAGSARTTAVRDGDNFILNGKKHFITNSAVADYCMLIANTDLSKGSKGLTAFLVDLKETPGISIGHIENKCGIRSAKVAEINIENAVIPASRMIGTEGKGFRYALSALNAGRLGVAAQILADWGADVIKVEPGFGDFGPAKDKPGSDAANIKTTAVVDGDEYIINGRGLLH